jgi:hypothetical protein
MFDQILRALEAAVGLAVTLVGLSAAGRLTAGRRLAPEAAIVAGWGAFCGLMTAWALAVPLPLSVPALALGLIPFLGRGTGISGLSRLAVLAAPICLVLLFARPSQVDTWLNLLPNLAFLYDHGHLPADGGPPSWSFLPAAPYNTQFVGLAISVWSGLSGNGLVANAMSLFNMALLCLAGLHLARFCEGPRAIAGDAQPAWWAIAAGLLLAIPLNPGFVPRVFFASYGEAPIAVTLMFAVSLGADLLEAGRPVVAIRTKLIALALVLVALVEIKQSALGLVLPFSATLLALGLAAPGMARPRWALLVAAATAPALALYFLYRWYVLTHFAIGELKMLPLSEWHLNLLPQILAGIAFAIFQKATYFLAVIAALAAAVLEARRRAWQRPAIVLALGAGLIAGFNAFLLFTYVAHFPAVWAVNAHSYFRYMSQLSLVVMLGLLTWLRPAIAVWLARFSPDLRRRAGSAAVAAALILPLAGWRMLRFDLDAPQPFLWDIAHRTAVLLPPGTARLALILPGDGDDAAGSLLRGVLLFTEPRRAPMDFRTELSATPASLEDARAAGFTNALVACAPAGLAGLPPGLAGLLTYHDKSWQAAATWPVPPQPHFSAMLPRALLSGCPTQKR